MNEAARFPLARGARSRLCGHDMRVGVGRVARTRLSARLVEPTVLRHNPEPSRDNGQVGESVSHAKHKVDAGKAKTGIQQAKWRSCEEGAAAKGQQRKARQGEAEDAMMDTLVLSVSLDMCGMAAVVDRASGLAGKVVHSHRCALCSVSVCVCWWWAECKQAAHKAR